MQSISRRMKPYLISQTKFPTLSSPHLLPQTPPFALFSLAKCKSLLLQNPTLFHLTSTISLSPPASVPPLQNRALRMEASQPPSGEIHVIVGPMFAGKTTSLLRRIQSESTTGRLKEAVRLLLSSGLQVDPGTYSLLLQECIFRKEYKMGRRIHAQMVVVGFVPSEYLKTKLLILYSKSGDLGTACILFEKLIEKSVVSWNAIISGYVQKGLEKVGLSLYYQMRLDGLVPDQFTFASVFKACAALATLEQGKQAHAVMIKCQIKENVVVNSALMDMYFKCSSLCDGYQLFDKSVNRNVITWTALMSGYGQHGRVTEVLDFFHRMNADGFKPNYVTFLSVLSACSHGGLVDKGWEYFLAMKRDYGIKPRGQHYAAMVDLLGRAGRLREAYEFVLSSSCKEHSVIWGALLGACRIHGDMDLLKLAAKKYFELEPENAGKYVVLSNAYATFGLWENVAKVRAVMKESGMIKEPGYSKLEVQKEVHFFHKGDNTHKQYKEVYEMVKSIDWILKDVGYLPDLDGY